MKLFWTCVAWMGMVSASAPSWAGQLHVGAGLASSNLTTANPIYDLAAKNAGTLGVALELDGPSIFTIEPGLNYVPKGYSDDNNPQTNY